MKNKGHEEEAIVATSKSFHRGSTSGTKFESSSSGTKSFKKKKKSGKGNKASPTVAVARKRRPMLKIKENVSTAMWIELELPKVPGREQESQRR